jgi:two-component system, NarL family, sensor histidine kinase UhpB
MEQRKNLYLVFKEAVNNAAKYADCTSIEVKFLKEKSSLVLGITDNGKGFNIEEMKNGNGLKNMELRAKEIKAAFQIQSAPGKGTQIALQMPITQNADRVR